MHTSRLDSGPSALAWLLFSVWVTPAVLAQPATGPFAREQAERGAKSFASACAMCHGTDLTSGTAPALAGASFLDKWGTRPVNALWMAVRQMPPAARGSLPADTYLDLTAFLLERNGHAPGASPLKDDNRTLMAARVSPQPGTAPRPTPPPLDFVKGTGNPVAEGAGPTQSELNVADSSKKDWLYHTHGYSGTRYAASTQITPQNAGRLRPACVFQLGEQSNFQTGPLVYNGRMYLTGVRTTAAIDASDCSLLWKYEWTPRSKESWLNNRGAAIKDGYLVRGTSDGYLLALHMSSGQLIWARRVADTSIGEAFTMAPLIFEDRILIGPAGSENGISDGSAHFDCRMASRCGVSGRCPMRANPDRTPGRTLGALSLAAARSGRRFRWMRKKPSSSSRSPIRRRICRPTYGRATTSTQIPWWRWMRGRALCDGISRWSRMIRTIGT